MKELDYSAIRPYGDTINDAKVQLSFTLPLSIGPEAREAARILANKMGVEKVNVVEMKELG
ncbi:MAG: OAM dimerization domain-containing protein, partial [Halanaerobiales bacterium]